MRRAIAVLALLAALPVQGQQVYRWVDAQGEVHYSGTPPPGQQVTPEVLRVPKGSSAPVASGTPRGDQAAGQTAQPAAQPAADAAEEAAREAEYQATRQRNCEAARRNIERLTNEPARRYQQPDGSYRKYGNDELDSRLAEARAAEAENCD